MELHEATHSKHKPLYKPKFTGIYILTVSKLVNPPLSPEETQQFALSGEAVLYTSEDFADIYTVYDALCDKALYDLDFIDDEGCLPVDCIAYTFTKNTRRIRETFSLDGSHWMFEMHWYTPSESAEHFNKFE